MYHARSMYQSLNIHDLTSLSSFLPREQVNAANVIMNVSKLAKESGENFRIKSNYPALIYKTSVLSYPIGNKISIFTVIVVK